MRVSIRSITALGLLAIGLPSCRSKDQGKPEPVSMLPAGDMVIAEFRRHTFAPNFSALISIESSTAGGSEAADSAGQRGDQSIDRMLVQTYRKEHDDQTALLAHVLSPEEQRRQALLALERPGQATEVFSYLPGLKRLVSFSSRKRLEYRGATITVQELIGGEQDHYSHETLRRISMNGIEVLEVQSNLKGEFQSDYPKVLGYYRSDNYMPVEVRLLNTAGEVLRIIRFQEIETHGQFWITRRTELEDRISDKRINIRTEKASFEPLSNSLFTTEHLIELVTRAAANE